MNCREFEKRWNDHLDTRALSWNGVDVELAAHTAGCRSCRERTEGYELLAEALACWPEGPGIAVPPGEPARLMAAWEMQRRTTSPRAAVARPRRWSMRWAVAASLLVLAGAGARMAWSLRPTAMPVARTQHPVVVRPSGPRPLSETLVEATTATLDLARITSASAARVGRVFLASSASPVRDVGSTLPETAMDDAGTALQSVGNDVQEGLRPLSGTARQAFGFLLSPLQRTPDDRDKKAQGRGA